MLVLSRRQDEEIVMKLPDGQLIRLMVVDIRGDKVRLGIDADQGIIVHRKEVYDAIENEKGKAA